MKRLIGILTIFSIVILGCSSSSNEDYAKIYEIVKKATEKTNASTSVAGALSMEMEMEVAGMEVPMNMDMDFRGNNPKANDPSDFSQIEMEMKMTIDIDAEEFPVGESITMYFKDGAIYSEVAGQKIKASSEQQMEESFSQIQIKSYDESAIKSATMKEEDNMTIINVVLDGDSLDDIISEIMKLQMANSELISKDSFKVQSMDFTYIIDQDGYVREISYNMNFELSIMGEKASYKGSVKMEHTSFEQQVIEFPDFSEYKEIETGTY